MDVQLLKIFNADTVQTLFLHKCVQYVLRSEFFTDHCMLILGRPVLTTIFLLV